MRSYGDIPAYNRWTFGAIECLERNCNCDGCILTKLLKGKCCMKYAVEELIKNVGKPTEGDMEKYERKRIC